MSISARVREQLLNSFKAELKEHIQTMTDGLLALEQNTIAGEQREDSLEKIFRAAHSLKGAARAVGVTMIEQLAHALEDVLDALRNQALDPTPALYTACYKTLDAIRDVHAAYESGATTPPAHALQVLANLQAEYAKAQPDATPESPEVEDSGVQSDEATQGAGQTVGQPHTKQTAPEAGKSFLSLGEESSPVHESPHGRARAPMQSGTEQAASPVTAPASIASEAADETIRVKVSKLDALMAQLSELLVTKIRAEQRLSQLRDFEENIALWQREWLTVRSAYSRLHRQDGGGNGADLGFLKGPQHGEDLQSKLSKVGKDLSQVLDYIGSTQERLREMSALISTLSREYANDTMHMSLVIDELEEEVKRVRMLPLSTITGSFARMVRDMAQEEGKEAMLRIVGGDTELDKRVLEQIKDPLIHLLRNAVDHGIETPEQRVAAGKYRIGTITLTAEQLGKEVVITVSDDGRGLDLEAIRAAVAKQDMEMAQSLNETELVQATFDVGVSTSPIVTDISGRGVGLDVVRRNVVALRGRIDVDWAQDEGTTFKLTLPLTLSSARGLLVQSSDEQFAIPLNAIEHIMAVDPKEIVTLEGYDSIRYHDRPLTLVRLSTVLGLPPRNANNGGRDDAQLPVLVLAAAERRMAFVVDALDGEQEIVSKGLGRQLQRVGGIAGATVMGSGEIVLILNVADLIKMARRGQHRVLVNIQQEENSSKKTQRAQRHILIVDDSITTRTLEKNILEAAGYRVQVATDGQEAWDVVAAGTLPDLVVSDVSMPRLDGIGLTQHIKGDARTAGIPVILVTSLDSPKDKARGIDAGADAYITKGAFDQTNLLETIEQLI